MCGQSNEQREKTVVQLESIFRTTGFPYHIVPLEQVTSLGKDKSVNTHYVLMQELKSFETSPCFT